ncbi:YibE/F family protein [Levilactobacillus bambusae]|uniref:YibE/F family protein n=1 Tax=Levilactobacillus bambusae TaxID=2024736 RepID=A0A2V1MZ61_9LACO|nr:YibE/F family protein [Levilactobacillus bambusae]PWG00102.1 YibE/F family protein [Levilactobacillus bambusae]
MKKRNAVHRLVWWQSLGLLLLGLLVIWGTAHDARLYREPVMKVQTATTIGVRHEKDDFDNRDQQVTQRLTGVILNGADRGQTVTVSNTYSMSQALDRDYRPGSQLFLTLHRQDGKLHATVKDSKRDVSLAFLVWLTFVLLILLMRFSGLMAFLSVVINALLFIAAIRLNGSTQGAGVLWIFGSLAVIFAGVALWIVIGLNRQMLMTWVATLGGTVLSVVVALVVFKLTKERGMYYESMQYVTQLPRPLFLAETMVGSLGAVMDESTDIISSLYGLKRERPDLSARQIFLSGRNIGKSIMGPLINVLFFIFVADTFAMALLYLKNGNSWQYTYQMNMSLGVIQSLISGIGIVLAVPIASWLASRFIKERD